MTPSVCRQITVSAGIQLAFSSSSGHGTTLALQGVSPSSNEFFLEIPHGHNSKRVVSNSSHVGHGESSSHATLKVVETLNMDRDVTQGYI